MTKINERPVIGQSHTHTDQRIRTFARCLKETCVQGVRCPIIAGGAIRDQFVGLVPADYDIFVDVSAISTDEKDDIVLLTALRLQDFMHTTGEELWHKDYTNVYQKGGTYETSSFIVYEINAIHPINYNVETVQVIGHNNSLLSTNPLQFVEQEFDYALVKGLFDPLSDQYHYSDEFLKAMETKTVLTTNPESYTRAINWNYYNAKSLFTIQGKFNTILRDLKRSNDLDLPLYDIS